MALAEKLQIASGFILDSPPGEFHEVVNDIRVLIGNDTHLYGGIKQAVHDYSVQQLLTTNVDDKQLIVSKFGELDESTFVDAHYGIKFKFDHIRQTASDLQPYSFTGPQESLRSRLDRALNDYVSDFFPDGASGVYADATHFYLVVVSNKYNSPNYWNGRWRSVWTWNIQERSLSGLLRVQVHYFEDGNVQLSTSKDIASQKVTASDDETLVSSIVKLIRDSDHEYQHAVNESYAELSESTFKTLRRALPVTRNKLDWNKINNYKVGNALGHQQQ